MIPSEKGNVMIRDGNYICIKRPALRLNPIDSIRKVSVYMPLLNSLSLVPFFSTSCPFPTEFGPVLILT